MSHFVPIPGHAGHLRRRVKPEESSPGGVGTELQALLAGLGVPSCGQCQEKATEWDRLGVAWCESHKGELVEHLREAAARLGWLDRLIAGVAAIRLTGTLDAIPALIEEGIRRAAPYPEIRTRHLLYHLAPMPGNAWRLNVALLRRSWELFNGKRVIAVLEGPEMEPRDVILDAFAGVEAPEFIWLPNDPRLREVLTFLPLFERVESDDPHAATFWGHAKGVTRGNHWSVARWRDILYQANLGRWNRVHEILRRFPLAGCFKKVGRGWSPDESASEWHYSGSFFWFRNRELFTKPDWRRIDQFWSGIEPYPSLHFPAEQAGCIFFQGQVGELNMYDEKFIAGTVLPAFDRWLAQEPIGLNGHALSRSANARAGVRVELGGGKHPRGAGWINVDREPTADQVVDFEEPGFRLPFADASIDELYSSHCLEHVKNLIELLREIGRVCRVGAHVEIRVPHWLSPMALCHGHIQVIPPEQVEHWCETAIPYWWGDCPRRLAHLGSEAIPAGGFDGARAAFPGMSDEQLLRFVPGAAHEMRYRFLIVDNR